MMRVLRGLLYVMVGVGLIWGAPELAAEGPTGRKVRVVSLGDSITKAVRTGVGAQETFSVLLQEELRKRNYDATVTNVGIGGERTDQSLVRLEKDVLALKPDFVLIMYGTNDSYVDPGRTASRLTSKVYADNLRQLVRRLRESGAAPILMTPPKWAVDAKDGSGKNPNGPLEPFVEECRRVAAELSVPLVDHYAIWDGREREGLALGPITTDGCHPNPEGQRVLFRAILPVVLGQLEGRAQSYAGGGTCVRKVRHRRCCR